MRLRYAGTCTAVRRLFPPGPPPSTTGAPRPSDASTVSPVPRNWRIPCHRVETTSRPRQWKVRSTSRNRSSRPPRQRAPLARPRREFERRKARREDRVRAAHPKIGGLILALSEDPQSTRAWSQGAVGEERLGARLDSLTSDGVAVLHDRRIVALAPTSTTSRWPATVSGSSTPSATRDARPCAWKAGSWAAVGTTARWSPRLHQARRRRHQQVALVTEALVAEGLERRSGCARLRRRRLALGRRVLHHSRHVLWPSASPSSSFSRARSRTSPRSTRLWRAASHLPDVPAQPTKRQTRYCDPEPSSGLLSSWMCRWNSMALSLLGCSRRSSSATSFPTMSNDGSDRRLRSSRSRRQTWPGQPHHFGPGSSPWSVPPRTAAWAR